MPFLLQVCFVALVGFLTTIYVFSVFKLFSGWSQYFLVQTFQHHQQRCSLFQTKGYCCCISLLNNFSNPVVVSSKNAVFIIIIIIFRRISLREVMSSFINIFYSIFHIFYEISIVYAWEGMVYTLLKKYDIKKN